MLTLDYLEKSKLIQHRLDFVYVYQVYSYKTRLVFKYISNNKVRAYLQQSNYDRNSFEDNIVLIGECQSIYDIEILFKAITFEDL
jgi:hypothetical protein